MKLRASLSLVVATATLSCPLACSSGTARNATANKTSATVLAAIAVASPSSLRSFSDADFAQHVADLRMRIKSKLGADDFSIVIERPFVVVGDESEEAVRQHATNTVKWAVDHLKRDFLKKTRTRFLKCGYSKMTRHIERTRGECLEITPALHMAITRELTKH